MVTDILYASRGDAMHTSMFGVYRWGFMSDDKPNGLYRVQLSIQGADIILMMSNEACPKMHCHCVVDCFGNLVKVETP